MTAAAILKIEKPLYRSIIIDHRYSADWAKSYLISHIIFADQNRKETKENIYTNIILG